MNFKILPDGVVKGGTASYLLDAETGVITYSCAVDVGALFFTKTFSFNGTYKVDPDILKSENLKVGETITIGQLAMKVTSILGDVATVSCAVIGQDARGSATLNCGSEFVVLTSMDATARVIAFTLNLGLRPI